MKLPLKSRRGSMPSRLAGIVGVLAAMALLTQHLDAGPVTVRHPEGLVHGFLALSTLDGIQVADGDLIQNAAGDRVTSRLVFHFKNGSLHDETAIYSQRQRFQLLSYRLVQRGPTFKQPLVMTIDCARGQVSVRYTDEDGHQKNSAEHMDLPPDLANGMILTLLKNIPAGSPPPQLSLVVATPKPRLVTLKISAAGQEAFSTGGAARTAAHYVVKVDIGGIAGLVAPIVGKQPPDSHVWVLGGEAPAFVRSEAPLFADGPLFRIELVSPVWKRPAVNTD